MLSQRRSANRPNSDFTPKSHWEIAEAKDWIDKDRAAKIAGARFVYLKGDLVRLEFALWQLGLTVLSDPEVLQKVIDDAGLKGFGLKQAVYASAAAGSRENGGIPGNRST